MVETSKPEQAYSIPSEFKEDSRQQLTQVARLIFSQYGFKKTTLEDIAKAARKGKSSIYYYFESKEEIFKAVVEHEAALLRHEITRAISKTNDPKEKMQAYVITRLRVFKNMANFYHAVRDDLLDSLAFIETMRAKYDNEEVIMIKEILDLGVSLQEFELRNTENAAMAIVTAMKGLEFPLVFNVDDTLEQRVTDMMYMMYYGVCKRK